MTTQDLKAMRTAAEALVRECVKTPCSAGFGAGKPQENCIERETAADDQRGTRKGWMGYDPDKMCHGCRADWYAQCARNAVLDHAMKTELLAAESAARKTRGTAGQGD